MVKITWKRFSYILTHALVGGLIAHVVMWLDASFIAGTVAGLLALIIGETKELVGRLKQQGTFENTVVENINALRRSQDEPYELLQTFGAIAVYCVAMGLLQLIGLETF